MLTPSRPLPALSVPGPLKALQGRLNGLELYAVGGAVRDALLGHTPADVDIAGPHSPGEMAAACESAGVEIAASTPRLGTLVLRYAFGAERRTIEYTSFREENYSLGHRPDAVTLTKSMERDAKRRDFTMNALYMSLKTGEVFDPIGIGLDDISRRVVRMVSGSTLFDDGLRILRMVRFASELDFLIDPETYRSAKANVHKLGEIAPERVSAELERILLLESRPNGPFLLPAHGRALLALSDLGALWRYMPLSEGAIAACARTSSELSLRYAALLRGLGAEDAGEALSRLRCPNSLKRDVSALIGALDDHGEPFEVIAKLGRGRAALFIGLLHAVEDPRETVFSARLSDMLEGGAPFSENELALSGKDICDFLGILPCQKVGRIKSELWRMCLRDPSLNVREKLMELLATLRVLP